MDVLQRQWQDAVQEKDSQLLREESERRQLEGKLEMLQKKCLLQEQQGSRDVESLKRENESLIRENDKLHEEHEQAQLSFKRELELKCQNLEEVIETLQRLVAQKEEQNKRERIASEKEKAVLSQKLQFAELHH